MTTATPDTDSVTELFDGLNIACDVILRAQQPCDQPAQWVTHSHMPCHDQLLTMLMCDRHKQHLCTGGAWFCRPCQAIYQPHHITVEPL